MPKLIQQLLLRLILSFILIVSMGPSALATTFSTELFLSVPENNAIELEEGQTLGNKLGVVQSRRVMIDFTQVAGHDFPNGVDILVFNLFPDASYVGIKNRVEYRHSDEESYTWFGTIEDIPHSSVILTVENGSMAGNIAVYDRFFQIRPISDDVHVLYEIDQSAFPQEAPPLQIELPEPTRQESLIEFTDDGSTIDVMVVYTNDVAVASGDIAVEIQLAVDETNESYRNSNITQRLRLVHTDEVEYDETGDMAGDLECITERTDDCLDEVHSLRTEYGADVVSLLVENGDYCGIAWLMRHVSERFESNAFSVVLRDCATGYYSFGHEIGHNMGAHHDRYVARDKGAFKYSHGYVHLGLLDAWRTVMAYRNECEDNGVYCTRIPYWSNPEVEYLDNPTGIVDLSDNALTLNNTALTVANFRESISDDDEEEEEDTEALYED